MGGGTGTGAAPVIADIARSKGIYTVAMVTTPFGFEGSIRMKQAVKGIDLLRDAVDNLRVFPNEYHKGKSTSFSDVFALIDDAICQEINNIVAELRKAADQG